MESDVTHWLSKKNSAFEQKTFDWSVISNKSTQKSYTSKKHAIKLIWSSVN